MVVADRGLNPGFLAAPAAEHLVSRVTVLAELNQPAAARVADVRACHTKEARSKVVTVVTAAVPTAAVVAAVATTAVAVVVAEPELEPAAEADRGMFPSMERRQQVRERHRGTTRMSITWRVLASVDRTETGM